MAFKVCCPDHLTKVIEFAVNAAGNDAAFALTQGLARLRNMAGSDRDVELHYDFAPQSFAFIVLDGCKRELVGGLIYSGPGQTLDGSAPTFTVSVDAPNNEHKWSVHT